MREEIVKLYKEYCEYVDAENMPSKKDRPSYMRYVDMNKFFKGSFTNFMLWLEFGDRLDFENMSHEELPANEDNT